jgi:hypothetical protein
MFAALLCEGQFQGKAEVPIVIADLDILCSSASDCTHGSSKNQQSASSFGQLSLLHICTAKIPPPQNTLGRSATSPPKQTGCSARVESAKLSKLVPYVIQGSSELEEGGSLPESELGFCGSCHPTVMVGNAHFCRALPHLNL